MDDLQALQPWLVLQHLPGLGPSRTQLLLEYFHSPSGILQADIEDLSPLPSTSVAVIQELQSKGESHSISQRVARELDYIHQHDIHVITLDNELFPALLKEISRPPLVLYVRGDPYCLSDTQVAIVGARKASKAAMELTYKWSSELVQQGLTITSGLALGIDGAAHQAALDQQGRTIAVLAHGIDRIYPKRHEKMAEQIMESGALVSEFPLGAQPKRDHFPRRNRIISGLSMGVLVVEAAVKSGSLITARYALEQNREVFAVPGSIHNQMTQGCHYLIKQGAYLAESSNDIISALNWQKGFYKAEPDVGSSPEVALSKPMLEILNAVPFAPIHIDQLIEQTGLSSVELSGSLLDLELGGFIESSSGSYQRIK